MHHQTSVLGHQSAAVYSAGYPIVWGLAEGSNTITSDAEAASYAGLDIAAKVFFGWAIMLCSSAFHRVQIEEEKRCVFLPRSSCSRVLGM